MVSRSSGGSLRSRRAGFRIAFSSGTAVRRTVVPGLFAILLGVLCRISAPSAFGEDAPSAADPWVVPFGSRPVSAAVSLNNRHDVTIENKTFRDLGPGVIAIRLENCQRVTIRSADFINVAEGVYAVNSPDITVVDCRYSNITGPAEPRTGANVANFVQLNGVTRALIDHNKGKGGDTEDVVSVYQSSHVVVEDNHFEGTNWTSGSGSGIALSDSGGGHNIARRNILVNIGQVGIFIAGGVDNQIVDNIIFGAPRAGANVGMYVWNQSDSASSGHKVTGNRVYFKKQDGTPSPYWNAGNCGAVVESNNDFSEIDPAAYRVKL